MAFKFEYTGKMSDGRGWDLDSTKRVTFELDDNDVTVSELLEEFKNFLQGAGYGFELGDRFEIVNDFKNWDKKSTGTSDPGYGAVPPQSDVPVVVSDPY